MIPPKNKPLNCPAQMCVHARCPHTTADTCKLVPVLSLQDPLIKRTYHSFFLDGPTQEDQLWEALEQLQESQR